MPNRIGDAHIPVILLIDDQDYAAELITASLQACGEFRIRHEPDPTQALRTALEYRPTVVLIDLVMPLLDGFDVLRQFRANKETRELPIILLSSEDSPENKVRAFVEGANDYLVKWPDKLELAARVRYHSSASIARRDRDDAFRRLEQSRRELLARTEELAESQAALHHLQKMEAVGKLTGGVAHDFNNVLQIISGNLQLLKMETAGNPRAQARVASAVEGVKRGARLASQLLAFARRQPLQPAALNPADLLVNMEEMLRRSVGSATALELQIAAGTWNIFVDPHQLENVILNLAINGRDAMASSGGSLQIAAGNATLLEDSPERASDLPAGEYVCITVADNGRGMPPEVRERAFEPFYTTKPSGEGTGLGLSMAYGFVKQSGGHIEIDSQPGAGTTVRILLPRTEMPVMKAPTTAPAPSTQGHAETILVVEDEDEVRQTTVELLQRLGYRTLHASNALAALEILNRGAEVDLLFTDVVMPGPLESVELARMARQLRPGISVLFASGYAEAATSHSGDLESGVTLLHKPYSHAALSSKIARMLRERQPVKSGPARADCV